MNGQSCETARRGRLRRMSEFGSRTEKSSYPISRSMFAFQISLSINVFIRLDESVSRVRYFLKLRINDS